MESRWIQIMGIVRDVACVRHVIRNMHRIPHYALSRKMREAARAVRCRPGTMLACHLRATRIQSRVQPSGNDRAARVGFTSGTGGGIALAGLSSEASHMSTQPPIATASSLRHD